MPSHPVNPASTCPQPRAHRPRRTNCENHERIGSSLFIQEMILRHLPRYPRDPRRGARAARRLTWRCPTRPGIGFRAERGVLRASRGKPAHNRRKRRSWRPSRGRAAASRAGRWLGAGDRGAALYLAVPAGFVIFTAYPMIASLYLSFTKYNVRESAGLDRPGQLQPGVLQGRSVLGALRHTGYFRVVERDGRVMAPRWRRRCCSIRG